jgi:hypothetical protein
MNSMELSNALWDAEEQHRKENKITQLFRLVGLSAGQKFTCSNFGKEDIFWAESGLSEDRYRALFKWAKSEDDFWKQKWVVIIEHEGLTYDGVPINGIVIEVKLQEI